MGRIKYDDLDPSLKKIINNIKENQPSLFVSSTEPEKAKAFDVWWDTKENIIKYKTEEGSWSSGNGAVYN